MSHKSGFRVRLSDGKKTVDVEVQASSRKQAEARAIVMAGPGFNHVVRWSKGPGKARSGNKPWKDKHRHRVGSPAPKYHRSYGYRNW